MQNLVYIFIIILLIHKPLSHYAEIDRSGLGIFVVEIILFIYFLLQRKSFRDVVKLKPCMLWGGLVLYHAINCYFSPLPYSEFSYYSRLAFEGYIMTIFSIYLFRNNEIKTLWSFIIGYSIFIILAFNIVSVDEGFEGRLRSEVMHPNQFAQCAGMMFMLISFVKFRLNLSWSCLILLSLIPFAAILGCASRNGFILLFFYSAILYIGYLYVNRISFQKIIVLILVLIILLISFSYILENTLIGERILNTEENANNVRLNTGTVLDYLGERGLYYIIGWQNFIDKPITGIGMWNFQIYNNYTYPLHSESLIHFVEGGLIGIILYISYVMFIIRNLYMKYSKYKNILFILLLMAFFAYLFVGVTAREFYYVQFYPILGLCICYCYKKQLKS